MEESLNHLRVQKECYDNLINEILPQNSSCWNEEKYLVCGKGDIEMRFMVEAPETCKLPGYPIISIQDKQASHWIQIGTSQKQF